MKAAKKLLALILAAAMMYGTLQAAASGAETSEPLPLVDIDYGALKNVGNPERAGAAVAAAIEGWSPQQKADSGYIEEITAFAEAAITAASSISYLQGKEVYITETSFEEAAERAYEAVREVRKALSDAKITLNRDIRTNLRMNLVSGSAVSLIATIDNSASYISADAITMSAGSVAVSVKVANIARMTNDSSFIITISPVLDGSYPPSMGVGYTFWIAINKLIEESVTVSLARDSLSPEYLSAFRGRTVPVGGVHNKATDMLDFKVRGNGLYVLKENPVAFSDVSGLDQETAEAVGFLAARGIVSAKTDTLFAPDDLITRAEFAMFITKAMYVFDPSLDGGFADVLPDAPFFGAAGAVRKHRLITYFIKNERGSDLFEVDMPVTRTLALAMSAIALNTQMRYALPKDAGAYLNGYTDRNSIPNWALTYLALAKRENLIASDGNTLGMLMPGANITRGEAALIVKRLYDKLW
ncbi:MAG: S-layer homology domain-containing protein [Clostridiales bacterium]|jgi:hypothetical protein|nr:S-layer homology domain-containing protein [Clostridiales bacterium]